MRSADEFGCEPDQIRKRGESSRPRMRPSILQEFRPAKAAWSLGAFFGNISGAGLRCAANPPSADQLVRNRRLKGRINRIYSPPNK